MVRLISVSLLQIFVRRVDSNMVGLMAANSANCMEERLKEMMASKPLEVVQSKVEGWNWECTFNLHHLLNQSG